MLPVILALCEEETQKLQDQLPITNNPHQESSWDQLLPLLGNDIMSHDASRVFS